MDAPLHWQAAVVQGCNGIPTWHASHQTRQRTCHLPWITGILPPRDLTASHAPSWTSIRKSFRWRSEEQNRQTSHRPRQTNRVADLRHCRSRPHRVSKPRTTARSDNYCVQDEGPTEHGVEAKTRQNRASWSWSCRGRWTHRILVVGPACIADHCPANRSVSG